MAARFVIYIRVVYNTFYSIYINSLRFLKTNQLSCEMALFHLLRYWFEPMEFPLVSVVTQFMSCFLGRLKAASSNDLITWIIEIGSKNSI